MGFRGCCSTTIPTDDIKKEKDDSTTSTTTIAVSTSSTSAPSFGSIVASYDVVRTIRACVFGGIFHAPFSHGHYNLLEYMTIKSGLTGYSIPIFKAFVEQFVYWSWFSNSLYHGMMEILTTMTINPTAIYHRIEAALWETQKARWIFWIPIQLLNFQYIPVRHQLNVVLLTSVIWTALLSAWYPPQPPTSSSSKKSIEA
jgi:protein Mpv17